MSDDTLTGDGIDEQEDWESDDGWIQVTLDPDDEEWPLQIGFADWIAHLHEDLVVEFVDLLPARRDVADVLHEDREVVSVQAGPGLTPQALGTWAHSWFADRLPDGPDDADD
ncbi:hypothetical protein [Kineococcus sp. SYSU DK003]|uniref:hypothetical protein n=1 Tax=Kineococcus sp. SYSU DK003 TaxID=3383124 RepID=UPI003D7D60B9